MSRQVKTIYCNVREMDCVELGEIYGGYYLSIEEDRETSIINLDREKLMELNQSISDLLNGIL